jgi:hypothetical protein
MLAVTLVAADAPSLHQHRETNPAWFDEECPSVRLAVAWSDPGSLPVVDGVHPVPPGDVVVAATAIGPLRRFLVSLGPRGPPPASPLL